MGLREQKKAATRTALGWAAIRLAVEHGLDNVKVDDIAEAAGVSPRTFNNYFSSKGEAIVSRHLDRCLHMAEELRRRPADEPLWEAITNSVLSQFEQQPEVGPRPAEDEVEWAAGVRVMIANPAVRAEMLRAGALAEEEIAAAVAGRTGTDLTHDLHPHLVAAAVMAATNVVIGHQLRADPPVSMRRLLTDALAQIAAGLPTP